MIRVLAFNHFSATVADMDRALGFWQDALGLDLLGRGVVLFRYLNPTGTPVTGNVNDPGRTHLCLEVENLDGLIARIHEAGHRTVSPGPVTIPWGDWQGFRSIYAVAPDDVVVELVERLGR
jgi:catechol 2,3-dioxygenase-like lactoylglutathione lyase family enzyme